MAVQLALEELTSINNKIGQLKIYQNGQMVTADGIQHNSEQLDQKVVS